MTKGDKEWVKDTFEGMFVGGLNQVVMPVLNEIKQELKDHREMIIVNTEQIGELKEQVGGVEKRVGGLEKQVGELKEQVGGLEEQVDELHGKVDRMDRKLTVVTDHQAGVLDNHEKRIKGLEVAVV